MAVVGGRGDAESARSVAARPPRGPRRQLGERGGVPVIQIETLDWCTFEHPELFYSYRRDGSSGRMEAVIGQR